MIELAVADNIVEVEVTLEEMVEKVDMVEVIECVLLMSLVAVEVIEVVPRGLLLVVAVW